MNSQTRWRWATAVLLATAALCAPGRQAVLGAEAAAPQAPGQARQPTLLDRLEKLTTTVTSLAFSPDGKLLAVAGDDAVRLWDTATSELKATLRSNKYGVYAVAFSADGKTLAASNGDTTVRLWELPAGKERATLSGSENLVQEMAFAPDGKTLATAGRDTIRLWDVASGKERGKLVPTPRPARPGRLSLAFSPDGKTVAVTRGEKAIRLWDVATGKETATLASRSEIFGRPIFSPDGKTLAAPDQDSIILWDVATGKEKATLRGDARRILAVVFSPDGKTLASGGGDERVRLWDVATGKETARLTEHTWSVRNVAFSPDGKLLASGGEDGIVRLWDFTGRPSRAKGPKPRATFQGHMPRENMPGVVGVVFSPDGKTLAWTAPDKTVRSLDVATGKARVVLKGEQYWSLAFSPDGNTLALGGRGLLGSLNVPEVKLWDVAAAKERITLKAEGAKLFDVAFSPDGKTVAAGGSGRAAARLWDAGTGELKATFEVKEHLFGGVVCNWSACLAFSPNGKTLVVGQDGLGGVGRGGVLWEVTTGKQRALLDASADRLAFSPDGRTLATTSYLNSTGYISLWDIASGKVKENLFGHLGVVHSLAFTPDGATLASGSSDKTIKLWDVAAAKERATLRGDTAAVFCVAISPDGRILASACVDGTIKLWDIPPTKKAK